MASYRWDIRQISLKGTYLLIHQCLPGTPAYSNHDIHAQVRLDPRDSQSRVLFVSDESSFFDGAV